jgi:hypothetical protein
MHRQAEGEDVYEYAYGTSSLHAERSRTDGDSTLRLPQLQGHAIFPPPLPLFLFFPFLFRCSVEYLPTPSGSLFPLQPRGRACVHAGVFDERYWP